MKTTTKHMESHSADALLREAEAFYQCNRERAHVMFGYPSNNVRLSPTTKALLEQHYESPFANNCGDIDERGYYAMDTKDVEKRIVGLFAEKFGMGDGFWGYVTSGGSESNSCGISLAFSQNPDGVLYYSQAAHYSIKKYARLYKRVEIPTLGNDVMDTEALLEAIQRNHGATGAAANIVLTHGTTQYGACDDVDTIVAFLRKHAIPYYLHVDAALFGGIPNDQTDAPVLVDCKARGIHSVCVSLHKYIGFPDVHSVFVSTDKPQGKSIAYIGQRDTTVSGSRSIPAFALYHHVSERLQETDQGAYARNVRIMEALLQENGVPFYRAPNANIFVIDQPSESTCRKFQLSCFTETVNGKTLPKAHVIVFPSHRHTEMSALAELLRADLKNE